MDTTTVSSREFNQDVSRLKKASQNGPVIITDRGKPRHVLLCIEDYERLQKPGQTLAEALYMPGIADIDFDPPAINLSLKPADFS